MIRRINLLFWLLAVSQFCFAQVTPIPALPNENKSVTLTFDATQGTAGLKDYAGEIYAHTGVITDKSTSTSDWKYVIAPWATNIPKA